MKKFLGILRGLGFGLGLGVLLMACQTPAPRLPAEQEGPKSGFPLSVRGSTQEKWRDRLEVLKISRLEDYALQQGEIRRVYAMDRFAAKDYKLEIQSFIYSQGPYARSQEELQRDPPSYQATVVCNADYKLQSTVFGPRSYRAHQKRKVHVYENAVTAQRILLSPAEGSECEWTWEFQGKKYGVRIVTDQADPDLLLNEWVDLCSLPQTQGLRGIEKFFLTDKFNSMTCVDPAASIVTLEDSMDALRSKVEVLLGRPVSREFLENYDPYAPLDFSQAPKFDSIYISYLVFRADFSGTLISRLLEFHADRGTRVKILVSDVIALPKDRAMFARMTQKHNNIKIQEYRYKRQKGEKLRAKFDEFHRTMHVKMLITTSKARPEWNVTYIGGRNIHDGFAFKGPPKKPQYPEMVDYSNGNDESFVHWRDFEVLVADFAFTQKAAAHFLTLWNYDVKTLAVRSLNRNQSLPEPASPEIFKGSRPLVRHYMSFPYKDSHSLEYFYADMLDAAEKSVKISTPYFRPTQVLSDALNRAVKRGVDIILVTRLDLEGDTIDWLLSDANKAGVNNFWRKLKIYEYTEPKVILHSKIVLIDGKFSFVGSVNLNKRSFIHDLENGLMVYGAEFTQRMENIFELYLRDSRRITEPLQTSPLKKVILDMFDTEF